MKLRPLHRLSLSAKQHQRDLIAAEIAVAAPLIMAVPPGIGFQHSYRFAAQRTGAFRLRAAALAAVAFEEPADLVDVLRPNGEMRSCSYQFPLKNR